MANMKILMWLQRKNPMDYMDAQHKIYTVTNTRVVIRTNIVP
jgi:hypothetical protein